MFKALVVDKDGTLYSAAPYVVPFGAHLSRHFDSERFLDAFRDFHKQAVIGETYDVGTLRPKKDGMQVRSAFWIPALVALHFGFSGSFQAEFQSFSQYMLDDPAFPTETELGDILRTQAYRKALVSNDDSDRLLRKMGIADLFDLKILGAKKDQSLAELCNTIESAFSATPAEITWIEDDMGVLRRLRERGYVTALRKTAGYRYIPEERLRVVADVVLEDELSQLRTVLS